MQIWTLWFKQVSDRHSFIHPLLHLLAKRTLSSGYVSATVEIPWNRTTAKWSRKQKHPTSGRERHVRPHRQGLGKVSGKQFLDDDSKGDSSSSHILFLESLRETAFILLKLTKALFGFRLKIVSFDVVLPTIAASSRLERRDDGANYTELWKVIQRAAAVRTMSIRHPSPEEVSWTLQSPTQKKSTLGKVCAPLIPALRRQKTWIPHPPELLSKFKANLNHIVETCLRAKQRQTKL